MLSTPSTSPHSPSTARYSRAHSLREHCASSANGLSRTRTSCWPTGSACATLNLWSRSNRSPNMNRMAEIPPLVHVTGVEVIGDHRLRLSFEDGAIGDIAFGDQRRRGAFER